MLIPFDVKVCHIYHISFSVVYPLKPSEGTNAYETIFVCSKFPKDFFSHNVSLTDLGLRQPRLEGEEYLSIVDEFMEAFHTRWPKAIVQVYFFQGSDT